MDSYFVAILADSLASYAPKRESQDIEWDEAEDYLGDATERPIQRDTYRPQDYYSGKKKDIHLKI